VMKEQMDLPVLVC